MTRDKRQWIKKCLLTLIRMQSTGSPADLAWKYGISERSIKRLISEMRDEGYKIVFRHSGNTYVFSEDSGQEAVVDHVCA